MIFSYILVCRIVNSWIKKRKPFIENRIPLRNGTRRRAQGARVSGIKRSFFHLEPYALSLSPRQWSTEFGSIKGWSNK